MKARTHLDISHALCGEPVEIEEGKATVAFETSEDMAVDEHGLVHGGFVFGLADHAAMLAVNDPNVVLGSAECRFLAPVRAGEKVFASAKVLETSGKKRTIDARAMVDENEVFAGTFVAFVLDAHVLA